MTRQYNCFICGVACDRLTESRCLKCHTELVQYRLAAFWATMRNGVESRVPGAMDNCYDRQARIAMYAARVERGEPVFG